MNVYNCHRPRMGIGPFLCWLLFIASQLLTSHSQRLHSGRYYVGAESHSQVEPLEHCNVTTELDAIVSTRQFLEIVLKSDFHIDIPVHGHCIPVYLSVLPVVCPIFDKILNQGPIFPNPDSNCVLQKQALTAQCSRHEKKSVTSRWVQLP